MLQKWIMLTLILISVACSPFKTYQTIDQNFWKRVRPTDTSINVGYFEIQSSGDSRKARTNLYASLIFHLRSRGFSVTNIGEYSNFLEAKQLPQTRILNDKELILLSGSLKERFLFQGIYQESIQFAIPNDKTNIAFMVTVYDARTGKLVGEFRLYGSAIDDYNLESTFATVGRFVENFDTTFQESQK